MAAATQQKRGLIGEITVPIALIGIVMLMVLPMPAFLVDVLLAFSLTVSIGVFLLGLFIDEPLQFSSFPAVILVATLLRLSVNVATTRLILLNGASGGGAAGQVVETFGRFVVQGNVVVGLVVFLILVVINFVVITKGAGRVAEVAARFSLDGMPGKQMAIDADLNAGNISADVARERRKNIEREADFFGAMDGASKFVKGDAIAGILITAINLIGGLLIGIASGMTLESAAQTFSILSIGDALVSQMPSLLISTAAGVVVTRSATGEQLGQALKTQMLGSRRAVGVTAGVVAVIGFMPGMPTLVFLAIAGTLAFVAQRTPVLDTAAEEVAAAAAAAAEPPKPAPGSSEEVEAALPLDVLSLEVGYELVHVVDPGLGGNMVDRIANLRRQMAVDLGIVIPPVHIRDNLHLAPDQYRFLLLGTEIAGGQLLAGRQLAMDPSGSAPPIDGVPTADPAFGTPATWIPHRETELAEALGYTVVDHATVVATHLSEVVKRHAHELLGRVELQRLFDVFAKSNPKVVEELVPNLLSVGEVLKVLRNLLRESVSIRDLRTIFESLAELAATTRDPEQLTELIRQRLARQLTTVFTGRDGVVSALVLEAQVEDMFRRSLREISTGTGGALDPELARRLGVALEQATGRMLASGRSPLVITAPDLRRYVRAFAERRAPLLAVLSFRELDPSANIRPFDTVSFGAPATAA